MTLHTHLTRGAVALLLTASLAPIASADPLADLFAQPAPAESTTTTTTTADPLANLLAAPNTTTNTTTNNSTATTTATSTTSSGTTGGTTIIPTAAAPGSGYTMPGTTTSSTGSTGATHSAATATGALADVTSIQGSVDGTSAILSWSAVTGADSYTIYYGKKSVTKEGGEYELSATVPTATTSYTLTGLEPNTTYYFTLTAEDSTGTRPGSEYYGKELSLTTAGTLTTTTETTTTTATAATATPATTTTTTKVSGTPEKLPETGAASTMALAGALALAAAYRRFTHRKHS